MAGFLVGNKTTDKKEERKDTIQEVSELQNKENEVAAINDANIELTERLEDSDVHSSSPGDTEATKANLEIDKAFSHDQTADPLPTYVMYETPAIKINPKR